MNQLIRIACVAMALGLLGACSRQVTVKIGVVAPMSGALAQYGKDIAHGAEIAVDELNAEQFTIGKKKSTFRAGNRRRQSQYRRG